jgi:hypothetical protein
MLQKPSATVLLAVHDAAASSAIQPTVTCGFADCVLKLLRRFLREVAVSGLRRLAADVALFIFGNMIHARPFNRVIFGREICCKCLFVHARFSRQSGEKPRSIKAA